jgi:hypothetical protein
MCALCLLRVSMLGRFFFQARISNIAPMCTNPSFGTIKLKLMHIQISNLKFLISNSHRCWAGLWFYRQDRILGPSEGSRALRLCHYMWRPTMHPLLLIQRTHGHGHGHGLLTIMLIVGHGHGGVTIYWCVWKRSVKTNTYSLPWLYTRSVKQNTALFIQVSDANRAYVAHR